MEFSKKSIIIAVLIVVLAVSVLIQVTSTYNVPGALTSEQAGQKALAFINANLVQTGDATLGGVADEGAFYKLDLVVQGQKYVSYVTKDGKTLFPSGIAIDQAATQPAATFDAPDAAVPTVDLYVMSFCPYGTQAESIMDPVAGLLGSKMNFNVRFIAHVSNGTVQSLHGTNEANEDMRQLCIIKDYGMSKWWTYVSGINDKCTVDDIETCWANVAKDAGLDGSKVADCVKSDGLALITADEALVDANGVTGSPTLIINDEPYTGSRTSDAFKEGICTGFTTVPTECSSALSTATPASQGGCG